MQEIIEFVKKLMTDLGLPWLVPHVSWLLYVALGGGGLGLLVELGKSIKAAVHLRKNRLLKRDLHPYFTPVEIKKATQYFVPTRCQDIDPSREQEPSLTHADVAEKLIHFFMKQGFTYDSSEQRFYIILADSGMGKTTFMINLYFEYVSSWFENKFQIKLLPLGYPHVDREIYKIKDEQKKDTILLLDAFDEDSRAVADYKKRMDDLLEKTHRFRKVIFTCRTQFFPSEEEEPGETNILKYGGEKGYHNFYKMYISPFDERDIKKYLDKKFSIFHFKKRRRAREIVKNSPSLMVRPMLLSYIDDLVKSARSYNYSYEIYEELIDRWIKRESRRYKGERREKFKQELYRFSRIVALDIYRNRTARQGLFIPAAEIKRFADEHGIGLKQMEMTSRSLLNRNALGGYKFAHISILEYFLAREAYENYAFYKEFDFNGMDQAAKFYDEWKKPAFEFLTRKGLRGKYGASGLGIKDSDLSMLKPDELEKIDFLDLYVNDLKHISSLEELKNLISLKLNHNRITDITSLKELKKIEYLGLSYNQITDISALKGLKNLKQLDLNNNQITDISALKGLRNLNELHLDNNPIDDISALKELKNMKRLSLGNNEITDISDIKELKNLTGLFLINNMLTPAQVAEIKKALPRLMIFKR